MYELENTGGALVNPVLTIGETILNALPGFIGAIIVILVGYVIGWLLGLGTTKLLAKLGLDKHMKKVGLAKGIGHTELSAIIGAVVKWYVFLVFLGEAVSLVNLGVISSLLIALVGWLPSAIVGVIVVIFGLIAAQYVGDRMLTAKIGGIKILTAIVRVVIIFFAIVIALNQTGLDVSIMENTFLLLVGGVALAFALAFGIGLGLGLKNEAEGFVSGFLKKNK